MNPAAFFRKAKAGSRYAPKTTKTRTVVFGKSRTFTHLVDRRVEKNEKNESWRTDLKFHGGNFCNYRVTKNIFSASAFNVSNGVQMKSSNLGSRAFSTAPTNSDNSSNFEATSSEILNDETVSMTNSHTSTDVVSALGNPSLDLSETTYYPVDCVIRILDSLHSATGLPWWLTILTFGAGVRLLGTPLVIKTKINTVRLQLANPEMKKYQKEMEKLKNEGKTQQELMPVIEKIQKVQKKHGAGVFTSIGYAVAQIPLYSITFFGVRRMCENYPEMAQAGAYWFTDLSVPDTTYSLAIGTSSLIVASIFFGADAKKAETEEEVNLQKNAKNVGLFMGAMMVPVSLYLPAGTMLYLVSTSGVAFATTMIMKIPGVDSALGFHPDQQPGAKFIKATLDTKSENADTFTYTPPHRNESRTRRRNRRAAETKDNK